MNRKKNQSLNIELNLKLMMIDIKLKLLKHFNFLFLYLIQNNCRIKEKMDSNINFVHRPKDFIIKYFDEKTIQIDLNWMNEIHKTESDAEHQRLNSLRQELYAKIDSAKKSILERFDALESKLIRCNLQDDIQQTKDEIFLDKYCLVLGVYKTIPIFELKLGVLLFSEFDDPLLEKLE